MTVLAFRAIRRDFYSIEKAEDFTNSTTLTTTATCAQKPFRTNTNLEPYDHSKKGDLKFNLCTLRCSTRMLLQL